VRHLQPDWTPSSHTLAFEFETAAEGLALYLIINAFWERLTFELPPAAGAGPWRRWIDTARPSPEDIVPWQSAPAVGDACRYSAEPRSVVALWRRRADRHAAPR
jgi:glycogen operon protein